jgi:multidrug resistance efflux pump
MARSIRKKRGRVWAGAAVVLAVIGLIVFNTLKKTAVDVYVLKPIDLNYTILANCTVDFPKPLDMTFLREGIVRSIETRDGDLVAKGQVLVRLDDFEAARNLDISRDSLRAVELRLKNASEEVLPNLEERLREFEVNLEQAQIMLKRYREIEAAGGISRVELEKAEKEHQRALSQYNQQKLELENFSKSGLLADLESQISIRRTQLELAEKSLADMTLTAPFEGTVLKVHVQGGQKATPAAKAVTVKENANWQLVMNVDQKELPFLEPGLPAVIVFDAYPEEKIEGEVSYICTEVDRERNTCELRVEIKEEKPFIKPGMAGKAEILAEAYTNVQAVPSRFIKTDASGNRVWLWNGEAAELRTVTARSVGERWAILEGLPEGSQLLDADLSADAARIKPGREVPAPKSR